MAEVARRQKRYNYMRYGKRTSFSLLEIEFHAMDLICSAQGKTRQQLISDVLDGLEDCNLNDSAKVRHAICEALLALSYGAKPAAGPNVFRLLDGGGGGNKAG